MKTLIKLIVVLVVVIVAALIGAYIYIDNIAKEAIERGSTYALKVDTTLNSASLKIFNGQLVMGGLNVSNPSGYKNSHFINLKNGDVAVTLGSLTKDVVDVPHLHLASIDMNLEKKDGKANYQVILDNLKGSETDTKPQASQGKRFIVRDLSIKNVMVHLDNLTPVGGTLDVPIDEIKLQNVGSDSNKGVLLKDLAGVIVKALFAAIVEKGGGMIPADIAGELKNGLAQLTDLKKLADVKELGRVAEGLSKPVEQIGKDVEEAADKLKKGLEGAMGGKNKKNDK